MRVCDHHTERIHISNQSQSLQSVEGLEKLNWREGWPGSGRCFISIPRSHHFRWKTATKKHSTSPTAEGCIGSCPTPTGPPKKVNCLLRSFTDHKTPSNRWLCRSSGSDLWRHRNILHMLPAGGALAPLWPTRPCVFLIWGKAASFAARRLWYRDKAYSSSRSWRWQQTASECWVSC